MKSRQGLSLRYKTIKRVNEHETRTAIQRGLSDDAEYMRRTALEFIAFMDHPALVLQPPYAPGVCMCTLKRVVKISWVPQKIA